VIVSVARRLWSAVRLGLPIEHGDTVWTCVFASEGGHGHQRVVAGQSRWLFGEHLGLALSALELRLLLLSRLGTASQHGFS